MEDVLEVYERPYNPAFPVICFDESSKQLVEHVRVPIAARPGDPRRIDDEYKRHGTANIFLATEPLTGKLIIKATERRTAVDCAHFLKELIEEHPEATRVVLVGDNLNTHTPACFYEAFPPAEARRLTERLELHYTPKHGSWLNVAEIQLSVLARQCLDRRIGSLEQLRHLLAVWLAARKTAPVSWHFTVDQARVKLRRLYPSTQ
jgi:hypothetical protein